MRQGEVWTLADGLRVLVVSNDAYNDLGRHPICVPLIRRRGQAADSDLLVFTGDSDHVAGMLVLPRVSARVTDGGRFESLISGATMAEVSRKLADLFAH